MKRVKETRAKWICFVTFLIGVIVILCFSPTLFRIAYAVITQKEIHSTFVDDGIRTTFVQPSNYRGPRFIEKTLFSMIPGLILIAIGIVGIKEFGWPLALKRNTQVVSKSL